MKCLRTGYCCIHLEVIIVDNPELGIVKNNLKVKSTGERCQHLHGDKGNSICRIHNYSWYKATPCFAFTQVELTDSICRLGQNYIKG